MGLILYIFMGPIWVWKTLRLSFILQNLETQIPQNPKIYKRIQIYQCHFTFLGFWWLGCLGLEVLSPSEAR